MVLKPFNDNLIFNNNFKKYTKTSKIELFKYFYLHELCYYLFWEERHDDLVEKFINYLCLLNLENRRYKKFLGENKMRKLGQTHPWKYRNIF